MKHKKLVAGMLSFLFIITFFSGCISYERPSDTDPETTTDPSESTESSPGTSDIVDYRYEMRQFVQGLSAYMKNQSPGFAIIPQNGEDIAIQDGVVFQEYMNAIDGIGREDLLYGYYEDNAATLTDDREFMLSSMDIYLEYGKSVLVIDYCSSAEKVQDSFDTNWDYGFISFAADERNLNSIPDLPQPIFHENDRDVLQLSDAENYLYIINPESYSSKSEFLSAIAGTNYDLIIVDLFWGDSLLTAEDVSRIKVKSNGAGRLVVCYMSIGEAEDYRYYWQDDWYSEPPAWLGGENPNWEGNYKVNYWDPEWQQIIYGNDSSYAKNVLNAGFDGVYLDLIDAFEYYEEQ
jgi:cysteinyl-tRNA synthetase